VYALDHLDVPAGLLVLVHVNERLLVPTTATINNATAAAAASDTVLGWFLVRLL